MFRAFSFGGMGLWGLIRGSRGFVDAFKDVYLQFIPEYAGHGLLPGTQTRFFGLLAVSGKRFLWAIVGFGVWAFSFLGTRGVCTLVLGHLSRGTYELESKLLPGGLYRGLL